MAVEARAETPAPAAPPPPVPEKRAAPEDDEEEERPGTKRRRAFVATLDGVPCAAAAPEEEDGQRGGLSFSFQHARGGFVALETTPKFGSFNPPASADAEQQLEAVDPKPVPPAAAEHLEALDPKPAPPAAAEQLEALDPEPALPAAEEDSPVAEEEEDPAESPLAVADREGGNSEVAAAAEGDQGEPERQNESECAAVDQQYVVQYM